jgi:hypothetical protein
MDIIYLAAMAIFAGLAAALARACARLAGVRS